MGLFNSLFSDAGNKILFSKDLLSIMATQPQFRKEVLDLYQNEKLFLNQYVELISNNTEFSKELGRILKENSQVIILILKELYNRLDYSNENNINLKLIKRIISKIQENKSFESMKVLIGDDETLESEIEQAVNNDKFTENFDVWYLDNVELSNGVNNIIKNNILFINEVSDVINNNEEFMNELGRILIERPNFIKESTKVLNSNTHIIERFGDLLYKNPLIIKDLMRIFK